MPALQHVPAPAPSHTHTCQHTLTKIQVTQSRQAVDVSDPVGLVQQLEALTTAGAIDYDEAIAQHSTRLEQMAAGMEGSKADIDRWVGRQGKCAVARRVQGAVHTTQLAECCLQRELYPHRCSMLTHMHDAVRVLTRLCGPHPSTCAGCLMSGSCWRLLLSTGSRFRR